MLLPCAAALHASATSRPIHRGSFRSATMAPHTSLTKLKACRGIGSECTCVRRTCLRVCVLKCSRYSGKWCLAVYAGCSKGLRTYEWVSSPRISIGPAGCRIKRAASTRDLDAARTPVRWTCADALGRVQLYPTGRRPVTPVWTFVPSLKGKMGRGFSTVPAVRQLITAPRGAGVWEHVDLTGARGARGGAGTGAASGGEGRGGRGGRDRCGHGKQRGKCRECREA